MRSTIRPLVKSYGESFIATLSPGIMRTGIILSLSDRWAVTICPLSSWTSHVSLGADADTRPSTLMLSFLSVKVSSGNRRAARDHYARNHYLSPAIRSFRYCCFVTHFCASRKAAPNANYITTLRQSQNLRAVLGDSHGVLEMNRGLAVFRYYSPAIVEGFSLVSTHVEHRLNRYHHACPQR